MSRSGRPVSLVAERAVRYLTDRERPASSIELAREVLSTRVGDEEAATRVLRTAFAGDSRLTYEGGWRAVGTPARTGSAPRSAGAGRDDADRVLLFLDGARPAAGRPFRLRSLAAIRLRGDMVIAACGGEPSRGRGEAYLRDAFLETIRGAVPVVHDPPGSWSALERWLEEPLDTPVSLRRLAQDRLGLGAAHDLETLASRLGLRFRSVEDPVEMAETLDACLSSLRRPGENLDDLRASRLGEAPPIDWERFAFDRAFLRSIPRGAGTYRFFDADGDLLYVGKSKHLRRRVGSYFREGARRSSRVQSLLDALHRIEIEPTGSDLDAVLAEASQIRARDPRRNVQRTVHGSVARAERLRSILILVPAPPPHALRAYLIRDGRLVEKVWIGPRGGGLRRIERVLDDSFFSFPEGPISSIAKDIDLELVARWLAEHRDEVVAFDPTHLPSSREVVERLRWVLQAGPGSAPDGLPWTPR